MPPALVAPFFSLARGEWVPYALTHDPKTGALREAGVSTKRQAEYQRRMSTLLADRQTAPTTEVAR